MGRRKQLAEAKNQSLCTIHGGFHECMQYSDTKILNINNIDKYIIHVWLMKVFRMESNWPSTEENLEVDKILTFCTHAFSFSGITK